MNLQTVVSSFVLAMFSSNSMSFTIDSMVKIADESAGGSFVLTSTLTEPEYIMGEISQINVVEGNIEKFKFTKNNLPLWDLTITPAKLVLNPGEKKRVAVVNLCHKNCSKQEEDKVYQIMFKPTVADENSTQSKIGINFGYAPYFIIPAKNQNISYDYKLETDGIKFSNNSNTLLHVQVDKCSATKSVRGCKKTYTFLAGREKTIPLNQTDIDLNKIKLKVASHNYDYNKEFYIKDI